MRVDEAALELAAEQLAALDGSGAEKQHIAVLGSASLALTPNLNNEVFARISEEGCEAVPSSLATQAVHNTLVEAGLVSGEQAAKLSAFAECTMTAQEHAFKRMGELGVGYAPALSYLQLERVAHRQGIDTGVNAGAGWCTQASMLSLADAGYHNVLFSQTFTCLSSHVAGSGVFKEVRAYDAHANLSSVEYDIGISHVNQINRIKLLTSLAKARG